MKFGIIGTNFVSDWFAEAVDILRSRGYDVSVLAVYSRTEERAEEFGTRHAVPRKYTSLDTMLADRDIDSVYIASPNYKHAEQAIAALRAGKHVLCEKMMAHTLDAFVKMKKCAHEGGLVLLEAMRPEFDPYLDVVKSAIEKIGKIRRSSFVFCQYSSRYDSFKSGDVQNAFKPGIYNSALADIGIYPLHTAISLFGKPSGIYASAVFLENGFLGSGEITLGYGEHICTVSYSKINDSLSPSVIDGEYGSISIDKLSAPTRITLKMRGEEPRVLDYTPEKSNMIYEIRAFAEMVQGNRAWAQECLRKTELCQQIADEVYSKVGAKLGE